MQTEERAGRPEPASKEPPSMTLGEYLAEAGRALRTGIPRAWVDAVVLEARETKSGISLELVEPSVDECDDGRRADQRPGRLRSMLWAGKARSIGEACGFTIDGKLLTGAHVRLLVQTEFDPRWHLEGRILDLHPDVIPGLVAKRLEGIRAELRRENLYGAQRSLSAPIDVMAVAVIHPDGAAGWADVRSELYRLQARGLLDVSSYPMPFEGAAAAGGIADALEKIGKAACYDVVLIVRGGGAAAGLASLSTLPLARAVCRCPLPIVTGIGHASDRTILDELAWRAADTPSKALGTIKALLRQRCERTLADHRTILDSMDRLLSATLEPLLSSSISALIDAAERATATQSSRLRELAHEIERHMIGMRGRLELTEAELTRLAMELLFVAPTVPIRAEADLRTLRAEVVRSVKARLPGPDMMPAEARRSTGLVRDIIERQGAALRRALASIEAGMRRRLSEETSRLSALSTEAQAVDLESVLAKGFVLPLDEQRHIIRSAEVAKTFSLIEFLFVDGSVACRPTMSRLATRRTT